MRRWAPLLAALALGCPAEPPDTGGQAPAVVSVPVEPTNPVEPAPPAPVGNAPAAPEAPRPDEGKNQLALRETRELVVGGVPLTVYLANTAQTRQLGLMHVKEPLPDRMGMLFVYPRASRLSFWMKNTYIPLSLAYVAEDGTIAQLVDMQPFDERSHRAESVVRFVIEVNQGWFEAHGVKVGAKVEGLSGLVGYD